jgi:uncharacterized protein (TIGR03435 family)
MRWLLALVVCLVYQNGADTKPSFEVASIKASTPGRRESMNARQPGRFSANNLTLRQLIGFAYRTAAPQPIQIVGGPNWIADNQWDIEATFLPAASPANGGSDADTMALRLQNLLENRFALKLHRDQRERPVYALVVDKNGSKLVPAAPPPAPVQNQIMAGPGIILASAVSVSQIAFALNRAVDRPIVDRTNLSGYFNMKIQFSPDAVASIVAGANPAGVNDPPGPSIFTAVQEQLGLRLESAKAPMEVLVIDSVQKPAEN